MRIVKPKATLMQPVDNISHVANCARICYKAKFKSTDKDNELFERLIKIGHYSMLRHASYYFAVPSKEIELGGSDLNTFYNDYYNCPYVAHRYDPSTGYYLFSLNGQFYYDNKDLITNTLLSYEVTLDQFKQYEESYNIIRYSFKLITQVSTSRELNRTSPNNIAEHSTRFCNYSKDKFGNEITICQPHWFNLFIDKYKGCEEIFIEDNMIKPLVVKGSINGGDKVCDISMYLFTLYDYDNNKTFMLKPNYTFEQLRYYLTTACNDSRAYIYLTNQGLVAQDARGMLPLDVMTEVIYTYTREEWNHIIDLRYNETTGPAHPNAKEIVGQIVEIFKTIE